MIEMGRGGISILILDLGMKHFQWTLFLRWIFSCVLCRLHIVHHVVNLSANKQLELDLSEDVTLQRKLISAGGLGGLMGILQ